VTIISLISYSPSFFRHFYPPLVLKKKQFHTTNLDSIFEDWPELNCHCIVVFTRSSIRMKLNFTFEESYFNVLYDNNTSSQQLFSITRLQHKTTAKRFCSCKVLQRGQRYSKKLDGSVFALQTRNWSRLWIILLWISWILSER
jgi:hypothetical protein